MQNLQTLEKDIKKLKSWFHNIHLENGIQTCPTHPLGDFPSYKWKEIEPHLPKNMKNWKVLDVGCNAGFYTFELAKKGAHVLGIDSDEHYLKQARWLQKILKMEKNTKFLNMNVFEVAKLDQKFDLIWFMGVFYHLRHPLLALDILSSKLKKIMVFQTMTIPEENILSIKDSLKLDERNKMLEKGWPSMAFIEKKLEDDPTNWWAPNLSAIYGIVNTSGLKIISNPVHEVFICEKNKKPPLKIYQTKQELKMILNMMKQ